MPARRHGPRLRNGVRTRHRTAPERPASRSKQTRDQHISLKSRFTKLGDVLAAIGLAFVVAGGVAYFRVQEGYDSLQAFSEAQNVELTYNEDGQLIDRGITERPMRFWPC